MMPFVPHLASECLKFQECKDEDVWPEIKKNNFDNVKIAVQINGKTKDILTVKKDIEESEIKNIVEKQSKSNKFIKNNKILKTIFVKNRIINYIIKK